MPYTIEKLADAPVVVISQEPGSDVMVEVRPAIADMMRLLDEQPEPVYLVACIEGLWVRVDQLSQAAEMVARGDQGLLHHPNVRETVAVTTSITVRMALRVLTTPMFGGVRISFADTLDEAIAHCQDALRHQAAG